MSASSFAVDSDVLAATFSESEAERATPAWQSMLAQIDGFYQYAGTIGPADPRVSREAFSVRADDGAEIVLHWFASPDAGRAAVVHAQGCGRIAGRVELFAPYVVDYVARSGVSFLSVEHRLAPEARDEVPTRDLFAGLRWLVDHAEERGGDTRRIAVMGDSVGGGLAAGAALFARENARPLAGQLLIYPMLDDRVKRADAARAPVAGWVVMAAEVSWTAALGDRGGDGVSELTARGRCGGPSAHLSRGRRARRVPRSERGQRASPLARRCQHRVARAALRHARQRPLGTPGHARTCRHGLAGPIPQVPLIVP